MNVSQDRPFLSIIIPAYNEEHRLPKSLHESLRHEAHERKTSMNQLCISKLLQIIDEKLVPND